jgi:5-deoxy-glucuronate isomerase
MFVNARFSKNGRKTVTRLKGRAAAMQQDIRVYRLRKGKALNFSDAEMETAVLLIQGAVTFKFDNKREKAVRKSFMTDMPTCVHVCKRGKIRVIAKVDSEILVQSTLNSKAFKSKIYKAADIKKETFCEGKWNGSGQYDKLIVFDSQNAPESNMVMGEYFTRPGCWSGYIPSWQPQPMVNYFKFEREEGFGTCVIGERAYKLKDGSASLIEGGYTNVQASAPGFNMYCCFLIRHLDGAPWKDARIEDPRYDWLNAVKN